MHKKVIELFKQKLSVLPAGEVIPKESNLRFSKMLKEKEGFDIQYAHFGTSMIMRDESATLQAQIWAFYLGYCSNLSLEDIAIDTDKICSDEFFDQIAKPWFSNIEASVEIATTAVMRGLTTASALPKLMLYYFLVGECYREVADSPSEVVDALLRDMHIAVKAQ